MHHTKILGGPWPPAPPFLRLWQLLKPGFLLHIDSLVQEIALSEMEICLTFLIRE